MRKSRRRRPWWQRFRREAEERGMLLERAEPGRTWDESLLELSDMQTGERLLFVGIAERLWGVGKMHGACGTWREALDLAELRRDELDFAWEHRN